MNYSEKSIKMHEDNIGKLSIESKVKIQNKDDLSTAYTPGVAAPCLDIEKNPERAKVLTSAKSTVAVITDGSAVLGLGDIGPDASLPVMEGKCILFKEFGGVNAFPIAINTQNVDKFVDTVKRIAPSFGGINLEDISAPRCFEIEKRLIDELDIPVFHDDQHGTAIVVLAGLINALQLTNRTKENTKIVMNGAGAAGVAITKLLLDYGFEDIIMCDSKGIISSSRDNLNETKKSLLSVTNKEDISGDLKTAIKGRDVFIGVSKGNLLTKEDIQTMNKDSIILAMANPTPEILPEDAKAGGAAVIATGRSDFDNQLNNVLVFPGIFKGALESGAKKFTNEMKFAAAEKLAALVENPTPDYIIPDGFHDGVARAIADAVKEQV